MENKAKEYYISREQYLSLKAAWSAKSSHEAWEMVIYNILRSKPIDHGFSEKKQHIQSNDPWQGFNLALGTAANYCPGQKCPWAEGSMSANRWENGMTARVALANKIFGIELPSDIMTKLEGQRK